MYLQLRRKGDNNLYHLYRLSILTYLKGSWRINYSFFFCRTEEKSDFDFMDEMSSPRLPVRRMGESTPKGSAKKKTASFNGVLSTMLRHRRLEQQEINASPKKNESSGLKPHPPT